MTSKLYYIQDTRQLCGNCAFWWGPNRCGYVCNLDEAGVYTEEEIRACSWRTTDVPRPKDEIDALAIRHVRGDQRLPSAEMVPTADGYRVQMAQPPDDEARTRPTRKGE